MAEKKEKISKTMLDETLNEIYKQAIAHNDKSWTKSIQVFNVIFNIIRENMARSSKYFKRYNTEALYASTFFEDLKGTNINEVDLYLVMNLPVSYDDSEYGIVIENERPGFVNLKASKGFDALELNPDWSSCYRETASWRDDDKYLLQSMFRKWMNLIFTRIMKDNRRFIVDDIKYYVKCQEPKSNQNQAYTLKVNLEETTENFFNRPKLTPYLDVHILPVIRFILPRWPTGYTQSEPSILKDEKDWFVVAKPQESIQDEKQKDKCWTLSFEPMELKLLTGCGFAKTVIKLIKKLHNTLGMDEINSDYIKSVFLWKANSLPDKSFWKNNLGTIFRVMIEELHEGIKNKYIPYFWYKEYNLLDGIKQDVLDKYQRNLKRALDSLFVDDVKNIVNFLLTPEELIKFNEQQPKLCERLQSYCANINGPPTTSDRSHLVMANFTENNVQKNKSSKIETSKNLEKPITSNNRTKNLEEFELKKKADIILNKEDDINAKIKQLENNVEPTTGSRPTELSLKIKSDRISNQVAQMFDRIKSLEQKMMEQK